MCLHIVHIPYFFNERLKTIYYIYRTHNLSSPTKPTHPREKLVANFHIGGHDKLFFAIGSIKRIFARSKSVNGRIEQVVTETNTDALSFTAKHREHTTGVVLHVNL